MPTPQPFLRLAALALALLTTAGTAQDVPQNLPVIKLQVGMHNIHAQVAQTTQQWQTGLMFRREMAQHEGMLFIAVEPSRQCFWMKNTLLPLTIAFLADDGTVVNLADMQPQALAHASLFLRWSL